MLSKCTNEEIQNLSERELMLLNMSKEITSAFDNTIIKNKDFLIKDCDNDPGFILAIISIVITHCVRTICNSGCFHEALDDIVSKIKEITSTDSIDDFMKVSAIN